MEPAVISIMTVGVLLHALQVSGSADDLRHYNECLYTHFGTAYVGDVATTRSGKTCQRWDVQSPHSHPYMNTDDLFPDATVSDAGNKCRNPNGVRSGGVWCFTTDAGTEWEYCDVPYCECKIYRSGHGYLGTHSATYLGIPCQRWDSQTPHEHSYVSEDFPDFSIQNASNHCRNPSPTWTWGTYCLTSRSNIRYQHCSLPFCECKTTPSGDKYEGYENRTVSGRSCQSWSDQSPHEHSYTDISMFPDTRMAAAASYCRNPDDSAAGGPWCYTTDPDVRWEYCHIPACEYLDPVSRTTTTTTEAPSTTPFTGPTPSVSEVTEKPATTIQECKFTKKGSSYRGTRTRTLSGKTCQAWTAQSPHQHPIVTDDRVADPTLSDALNYCRNPNMASLGPWCYTTSANTRHEYCDIPLCECRTSRVGKDYIGLKRKTSSGFDCQSWSEQSPHRHDYTDSDFPDGSVEHAGNYCRNPRGDDPNGPWCLTTDPDIRWDTCALPYCDCKEDVAGMTYTGTISTTVSGKICQRWDSQTPHQHTYEDDSMFPEGHAADSRNHCRNPDNEEPNGPWCFTVDPDTRWEYCDVSLCELAPLADGTEAEDHPPVPTPAPDYTGTGIHGVQECKLSQTGETYAGHMSHTISYRACQRWDRQEPHKHPYTSVTSFPDQSLHHAGDGCRNPDRTHPEGPWCYTMDPDVEWEYCPVPSCGCKVNKGGWTYTGTMSVTRGGYTCQRWDSQFPHKHTLTKIDTFADRTFEEASNYCRNPDMWEPEGPWCLTTDPNVLWDYCDIPFCECTTTVAGHEYGGRVNKTKSGIPCQRWDSQSPHLHRYYDPCPFPEDDITRVENFCRNPEQNDFGGPWCFTTDADKQWEYCDVPLCEDDGIHPLISIHNDDSDGDLVPKTAAVAGGVFGSSLGGSSVLVIVLGILVVILTFIILFSIIIYPRRAGIQAVLVRAKEATSKAFDNPLYAESTRGAARFRNDTVCSGSVKVEVADPTLQPPLTGESHT